MQSCRRNILSLAATVHRSSYSSIRIRSPFCRLPSSRHSRERSYYSGFVAEWRQPFIDRSGWIFRTLRIPVIALGIYSIGYHQGVIESHNDPQKFKQQLLNATLLEHTKVISIEDVEVVILTERDVEGTDDDTVRRVKESRIHQVAWYAKKIIDEGRLYVEQELTNARMLVDNQSAVETSSSKLSLQKLYETDASIQFWEETKSRINGNQLYGDPWQFIFVTDPNPNAWVTEILPKRIFITTGMLDFVESIDEAAFLISHELSHILLNHHSKSNNIKLGLKTAEIILLSLDPTAGLLAFGFVAILDMISRLTELSFSRDHERDADRLGLMLTARCGGLDLQAGSRLLTRLHDHDAGGDRRYNPRWLDSHPSNIDRARVLQKECQVLQQDKRRAT